jgi:hypothetical protein
MEEEWAHLDADVNLLGLDEGLLTECRIVGDAEPVGGEGAAEEREAEMSERDLPSRGIREGGLNAGPVVVRIQEEGNGDKQEQDNAARYCRNGDPQTTPVHHRNPLSDCRTEMVRCGSSELTIQPEPSHPTRNTLMVLLLATIVLGLNFVPAG